MIKGLINCLIEESNISSARIEAQKRIDAVNDEWRPVGYDFNHRINQAIIDVAKEYKVSVAALKKDLLWGVSGKKFSDKEKEAYGADIWDDKEKEGIAPWQLRRASWYPKKH